MDCGLAGGSRWDSPPEQPRAESAGSCAARLDRAQQAQRALLLAFGGSGYTTPISQLFWSTAGPTWSVHQLRSQRRWQPHRMGRVLPATCGPLEVTALCEAVIGNAGYRQFLVRPSCQFRWESHSGWARSFAEGGRHGKPGLAAPAGHAPDLLSQRPTASGDWATRPAGCWPPGWLGRMLTVSDGDGSRRLRRSKAFAGLQSGFGTSLEWRGSAALELLLEMLSYAHASIRRADFI